MLRRNFTLIGSAVTPLIGESYAGILTPLYSSSSTWKLDAPKMWATSRFPLSTLVDMRKHLVWATRQPPSILHDIAIARKPVDISVEFARMPLLHSFTTDREVTPYGPRYESVTTQLTGNPSADTRLEKIASEEDLPAQEALHILRDKGFDEYTSIKLLTSGCLGIFRKLVPTRNAITAVDDLVGKQLRDEIASFPEHDYTLFYGSVLSNHFYVALFPHAFGFELFELSHNVWLQGICSYTTDHENHFGRTTYASQCAGGYYASRLPLLQYLSNVGRRAAVLVIRVIHHDYNVPMGVWVVREATRLALQNPVCTASGKEELIQLMKEKIYQHHSIDVTRLYDKSLVLASLTQTRLTQFQSQ